jgi:hypothetical protein
MQRSPQTVAVGYAQSVHNTSVGSLHYMTRRLWSQPGRYALVSPSMPQQISGGGSTSVGMALGAAGIAIDISLAL